MTKTVLAAGLILLLVTVYPNPGQAETTADWITRGVSCVDTVTGTSVTADSAQIFVFFGNSDWACYMASEPSPLPDGWIDTTDEAGILHPRYVFRDEVKDCDCDSGAGIYRVVVALFAGGVPTDNYFEFTLYPEQIPLLPHTKKIYCGGSDTAYTNDGLSWKTAIGDLRFAETACTGAKNYEIHLAAQTFSAESCTINVANVKIIGAGWTRTVLNGESGKPVIRVNHTGRGVEISDLTIQSDAATSSWGIQLQDVDGFWIHDCRFDSCWAGVNTQANGDKGLIERCFAFASGTDGFALLGNQTVIQDCFVDSLLTSDADGIAVSSIGDDGESNFIVRNFVRIALQGDDCFDVSDPNMVADNYAGASDGATGTYDVGTTNLAFVGNHEESFILVNNTLQRDAVYATGDSMWRTLLTGEAYDGDSLKAGEFLLNLAYYWGACNNCYYRMFPDDGSTNKDSIYFINPNLSGTDTVTSRITYKHKENPAVYDTAYFDRNDSADPWTTE